MGWPEGRLEGGGRVEPPLEAADFANRGRLRGELCLPVSIHRNNLRVDLQSLGESLLEVFAEETCLFFIFSFYLFFYFIDVLGCARSWFQHAGWLVVACELQLQRLGSSYLTRD